MEKKPVRVFEKGNRRIKIFIDEYPENPREWDNLGTITCFHNRYLIGDKHKFPSYMEMIIALVEEEASEKEMRKLDNMLNDANKNRLYQKLFKKYFFSLPVYIYDHSGITINTSGFSCPWDSGEIGIIYVPFSDIKKNFGVLKISKKLKKTVEKVLISEISSLDQYLRGEVYGFEIYNVEKDEKGNEFENYLDGCWGYYGIENIKIEILSNSNILIDCFDIFEYEVETL